MEGFFTIKAKSSWKKGWNTALAYTAQPMAKSNATRQRLAALGSTTQLFLKPDGKLLHFGELGIDGLGQIFHAV